MALKNQTKTAAINIKFESHDNPNEFSSGYYIRWPEICVIFFILVLWMLSLRKFFKHFEKIRNIHYREIPFKYKLKDPQNLSKIRVCRYPSQGVIFTNDPIANVTQSRQYSMCSELMMTPKNSLIRQSSIFPNEEFDSLKRKLNIVISEADEYKSFEMIDSNDANDGSLNDLYANNKSLNSNYELSVTTENSIPKVNDLNEPQSNSLTSLQHNNSIKKLYERDRLHSSMHTDERIYDRFNTTQRRKIFKNEKKISFNSHLNSLSVSTIVKKVITKEIK